MEVMAYDGVDFAKLISIWPQLAGTRKDVVEQVEIEASYAGYIDRQEADIIAFRRDEDAYCREYGLTDEQRLAVAHRNVLELIAAGGNIYYLAKFAGILGLDVQDVGAQQTGMSKSAFQEKLVGGQIYYVFALAMLLVYLVLAGQYESWYAPMSVLFAVPLSLIGPVAVMLGLRIDNNLYVQIGLVLLIALSAKNAILIVEVARELRAEGKSIMDSAVEAAKARFRPILMTSFAFIFGVLPLVWAVGAGAELRQTLGTAVFSGMIGVTFFGLIFTPAFYVICRWIAIKAGARRRGPAPQEQPAE